MSWRTLRRRARTRGERSVFIQPDDGGRDVFLHISAVERAGIRDLREGQKVAYEVVVDARRGINPPREHAARFLRAITESLTSNSRVDNDPALILMIDLLQSRRTRAVRQRYADEISLGLAAGQPLARLGVITYCCLAPSGVILEKNIGLSVE